MSGRAGRAEAADRGALRRAQEPGLAAPGRRSDLAGDALHDAYLRLSARDDLDGVRHPQTYLVNTAVHAAIDRIRQDTACSARARSANSSSWRTRPRPGRDRPVAFGHAGMFKALDMLTPRQRHPGGGARRRLSRPELAQRWGISLRLVGRELQTAHEHCLRAMRRAQDVATPGQPPVEPGRRGQERRNNASKCVFRAFGVPFAVAQTSKQENGASARAARTRP